MKRSGRGSILVVALMAMVLLLFIATALLRLMTQRGTTAARVDSRLQAQALTEGATYMVLACMQDSDFPRMTPGVGTCAPDGGAQACFPNSLEGRRVTVSWSGTPPACRVKVKVE